MDRYKIFKNESSRDLARYLEEFKLVTFRIFLKKGKQRDITDTRIEFWCKEGCSRKFYEKAFQDFTINKDGKMDGWYRCVAIIGYNEAQCSHPETGQNDFDSYWDVTDIAFEFLHKRRTKKTSMPDDLPF